MNHGRKLLTIGTLCVVAAGIGYLWNEQRAIVSSAPPQAQHRAPDSSGIGNQQETGAVVAGSPRLRPAPSSPQREKIPKGQRLPGSNYNLIDRDGRPNPLLMELAAIDPERRKEFDQLIARFFDRESLRLRGRLIAVPEESKGNQNTWIAKGSEESVGSVREDVYADLKSTFGRKAAETLTPYFTDYFTFAGGGQYDLRAVVTRFPDAVHVKAFVTDPADGHQLLSLIGTTDGFRSFLGTTFDVPPEEPHNP